VQCGGPRLGDAGSNKKSIGAHPNLVFNRSFVDGEGTLE